MGVKLGLSNRGKNIGLGYLTLSIPRSADITTVYIDSNWCTVLEHNVFSLYINHEMFRRTRLSVFEDRVLREICGSDRRLEMTASRGAL